MEHRVKRGLKAVALALSVSFGLWIAWQTLVFCRFAQQIAAVNAENAKWDAEAAEAERAERIRVGELADARQTLEAAGATVHLGSNGSMLVVDLSDTTIGPEIAEVFARLRPYFVQWHFRDEHDARRVVRQPLEPDARPVISLRQVDSTELHAGRYDLPGVGKVDVPNPGRRLTWLLADTHGVTSTPLSPFSGGETRLLANPGRSIVSPCRLRWSYHVLRPGSSSPITRHYILVEALESVALINAAVDSPFDSPAPYYLQMPWEYEEEKEATVLEEFEAVRGKIE